MSSHRRATKYFSRKYNARKALWRGLISSLVEHERITTTVEKAKELKRHVEKAITLGKKDDLSARRLLLSRVPNETTVDKIIKDLSARFKTRPGGYTRIIKIGRRPGDTAEMAFIEFVDYDYEKKSKSVTVDKADKKTKKTAVKEKAVTQSKEKSKAAKLTARAVAARKKNVAKIQKKSRAENRA